MPGEVGRTQVGKTKDAGWQIGVSRTIPVDLDTAWAYLTSPRGIDTWLGSGVDTPLSTGQSYETDGGTTGQVRSVRDRDRVRLTWQPVDRPDAATIQIALSQNKTGCAFRFHTERLYDSDEREYMRGHWQHVADEIAADLADRTDSTGGAISAN